MRLDRVEVGIDCHRLWYQEVEPFDHPNEHVRTGIGRFQRHGRPWHTAKSHTVCRPLVRCHDEDSAGYE